MHRYLRRRLGDELAGELAAETFLHAFRSRRRFTGEAASVLAWLYGIAANLVRLDDQHWTPAFVGTAGAAWAAFMTEVLAATSGTTLQTNQVALGYYSGVNAPTTLASGRVKQTSKLRAVPLEDIVTGHTVRAIIGSQRKRLTSDTCAGELPAGPAGSSL